jgi:hypothetical protein
MRRVVGLCLVGAILEMASLTAILHTHVYTDHDHPEHHHGLAAHEHGDRQPPAEHHDHDQFAWATCDPSVHKTQVRFVSPNPAVAFALLAEPEEPFSPVADMESAVWVFDVDVRAHGPPARGQTSPRAPPLIDPSIT